MSVNQVNFKDKKTNDFFW